MKKNKWIASQILAFLISAFLIFLGFVKFKYGLGKDYPDIGANLNLQRYQVGAQGVA